MLLAHERTQELSGCNAPFACAATWWAYLLKVGVDAIDRLVFRIVVRPALLERQVRARSPHLHGRSTRQ